MADDLRLHVGVKTDPIEYRYSFEWLFRLMADEGVRYAQLGSFFEMYWLPDDWFVELRALAHRYDVKIASLFTTHRERGGFYRGDKRWEHVARRSIERSIEVGAIVGAQSVGSNPGAAMRDEMDIKDNGTACYVRNMKELMGFAKRLGMRCLAIEPMSCLAEPPTLPGEIKAMCEELLGFHRANPETTCTIGCCADVAHGYVDSERRVVHGHMELLEAALPYTTELHLKNTDEVFESTFGFTTDERKRGVVDVEKVREFVMARAGTLPVHELVGYLEIGGPKTGRDYSDSGLERQLRESLQWCRKHFET